MRKEEETKKQLEEEPKNKLWRLLKPNLTIFFLGTLSSILLCDSMANRISFPTVSNIRTGPIVRLGPGITDLSYSDETTSRKITFPLGSHDQSEMIDYFTLLPDAVSRKPAHNVDFTNPGLKLGRITTRWHWNEILQISACTGSVNELFAGKCLLVNVEKFNPYEENTFGFHWVNGNPSEVTFNGKPIAFQAPPTNTVP